MAPLPWQGCLLQRTLVARGIPWLKHGLHKLDEVRREEGGMGSEADALEPIYFSFSHDDVHI